MPPSQPYLPERAATTGLGPAARPLHVRIDAGPPGAALQVICVHGLTQNGGVFRPLSSRLAAQGRRVAAVDLRGHGRSLREPPWNIETHVEDLLATAERLGIDRATWIGHSFGAKIIASLAERRPEMVERLALLDPGLQTPRAHALRQAEQLGHDWSFATIDGAVNALLATDAVVAAPRSLIEAYVHENLKEGPDGRLRFDFSTAAAIVAWSELTLPPPEVAAVPTLIVRARDSLLPRDDEARYEAALGEGFHFEEVPNGHNVMWDSPAETVAAIERFLASNA